MKYRYRFHPDDYALGENEKFYGDMEAKGWRLVKRKQRLSKFEPCEPSAARYRIEVAAPEFMGETELSEEQLMVYADCGWEHVASYGLLHFFRAPEGSDAPEFYADPRQQAVTLKKLRRQYLLAWLPVAILAALWLSMTAALQGNVNSALREGVAELRRRVVILPGLYGMSGVFLLFGVYDVVRGAVRISRTYGRMKKGIALDHTPAGRHLFHRAVKWAVCIVAVVGVGLTLWQLAVREKTDLHTKADAPYLLFSDLGYEGERSTSPFSDDGSAVEHIRSPLAEIWMTEEYLDLPDGDWIWMDQHLYRLGSTGMAEKFAGVLMETAIFIREPENFRKVDCPGLDAAWVGGLEIVAVKGDLVIYLVCSSEVYEDSGLEERVLPALAEKWSHE